MLKQTSLIIFLTENKQTDGKWWLPLGMPAILKNIYPYK